MNKEESDRKEIKTNMLFSPTSKLMNHGMIAFAMVTWGLYITSKIIDEIT